MKASKYLKLLRDKYPLMEEEELLEMIKYRKDAMNDQQRGVEDSNDVNARFREQVCSEINKNLIRASRGKTLIKTAPAIPLAVEIYTE